MDSSSNPVAEMATLSHKSNELDSSQNHTSDETSVNNPEPASPPVQNTPSAQVATVSPSLTSSQTTTNDSSQPSVVTTTTAAASSSSSTTPAASQIAATAATTTITTTTTTTTTTLGSGQPFFPLTRSRMRENLDNQDIIDINNIDDGQDVAKKARLFSYKLTEEEFTIFNDIIQNDKDTCLDYFTIRNRILDLWFCNVQTELTRKKAYLGILENIDLKTNLSQVRDAIFVRAFEFLDRTGRINFGMIDQQEKHKDDQQEAPMSIDSEEDDPLDGCDAVAPPEIERSRRATHMASHLYKPPLKSDKRTSRVIVIGAGLSGLMAARQLQRFGMEVLVVEARNRCGGRVETYRRGNFIADKGPSSLNGVVGNPLVTLGKQLDLCVMELKQRIPIYESKNDSSHPIDPLFERAVEREYHKVLEGTRVMKNNYAIDKYHGQYFPVGQGVNWVMTLQEKNIKDEQIKYLKLIDELYQKLIDSSNKKLEKCITIKKLHGQLCSIKDSVDIGNHNDKSIIDTFTRRSLARDLDLALKEYKLLLKQEEEIKGKISNLTKCPPSDTYLSLCDRRLLDWHFAELEYALGCPINKLSIHYEDDEEIFEGSHWMLVHGFNTIVDAMKNDLDISLNTAVKKITVTKNGCKVLTYNPDQSNSSYKEITADAVLCTLPLGTMQESIVASRQASVDLKSENHQRTTHRGYQPVIISPPLPTWKEKSINKLGCGNLNKIILNFDKVFWDPKLHLFGVVNHKAMARGEFFLFWHHGRSPTLTGLLSGDAADFAEKMSDLEILERCLVVLRSIYSANSVPAPKDYVVTRWRKDQWAKGAWSYLQIGADGSDYDTCAEPVVLDHDEKSFKETRLSQMPAVSQRISLVRAKSNDEIPRLFFAGEHTTKTHFASAHGAVMTGLREAARIANTFLGCPYDPKDEPGMIIL